MGLSPSLLLSSWEQIMMHRFFGLAHNIYASPRDQQLEVILRTESFKKTDLEIIEIKPNFSSDKLRRKNSITLNGIEPVKLILETTLSFKNLVQDITKPESKSNNSSAKTGASSPTISLPEPAILFSPRPVSELDAAAVKLQKVYKSYKTRRNLADCAVVVEELWWKALDSAALRRSSVSFFDVEKPETAFSKWARARTRAAKVGKGLSKNDKAQKLALQHWLEAIDPRHRYGHNLHLYYDIWFESQSAQPFFYWLDVGDGKEINLEKCPRSKLHRQCISYLGQKEREAYEVIVEDGKLAYKQSGVLVETVEGSKWIFVLSTSRNLYVGQKKKGEFQHSSFLSGGATISAGRLVAHGGVLEAIWPYSGHYHPTEENFREFISFLEDHDVDLTNVKRCAIDDDCPSISIPHSEEPKAQTMDDNAKTARAAEGDGSVKKTAATARDQQKEKNGSDGVDAAEFNLARRLSCKWSTGTGPRIGIVREYPASLQLRALEQVNLSPRPNSGPFGSYGPIPSPRPSPKIRLSPRISYMGIPSPRTPNPPTAGS